MKPSRQCLLFVSAISLTGCTVESAIHECSLEAAKAVAAAPAGLESYQVGARYDRVFSACMTVKGYRRVDGGTDLYADYVKTWERDWWGRQAVNQALGKK